MQSGPIAQAPTASRWKSFGYLVLGVTGLAYAADQIVLRHTDHLTVQLGFAVVCAGDGARRAWRAARSYHAPMLRAALARLDRAVCLVGANCCLGRSQGRRPAACDAPSDSRPAPFNHLPARRGVERHGVGAD
jgi:hypothetical protein